MNRKTAGSTTPVKDTVSSLRGRLYDAQAYSSHLEDQVNSARRYVERLREQNRILRASLKHVTRLALLPDVPEMPGESRLTSNYIDYDETPF